MFNEDGSIKEGSKLVELLGKFMDENPDKYKYGSPEHYGDSWRDAWGNGEHKVDGAFARAVGPYD